MWKDRSGIAPVMSLVPGRTSPRPQAASAITAISPKARSRFMPRAYHGRGAAGRGCGQSPRRRLAGLAYNAHMATARLELGRESGREWLGFGALLPVGAALWFVCRFYPAELPFILPWEFSWPVFLATGLSLAWFVLGLKRLPRAEHPPLWRSLCYVAGVGTEAAPDRESTRLNSRHRTETRMPRSA